MNFGAEIDLLEDKYNVMIFIETEYTYSARISIAFKNSSLNNHKECFAVRLSEITDYPQLTLRHVEDRICLYLLELRKKKLERICQS